MKASAAPPLWEASPSASEDPSLSPDSDDDDDDDDDPDDEPDDEPDEEDVLPSPSFDSRCCELPCD
jgi:hypothetical protein